MLFQIPPIQSLTADWLAFLTPISVAVLAIINVWIANRAKKQADEVKNNLKAATTTTSMELKEVRATQAAQVEHSEKITDKLQEVHNIVNGERGVLLEGYASSMETVAELTKSEKAIESAKQARALVNYHKLKLAQASVLRTTSALEKTVNLSLKEKLAALQEQLSDFQTELP